LVAGTKTTEMTFYSNGLPRSRSFKEYGAISRDPKEGPAHITFGVNGELFKVWYFVDGKASRDPLEGPAVIKFDAAGNEVCRQYWVNGVSRNDVG